MISAVLGGRPRLHLLLVLWLFTCAVLSAQNTDYANFRDRWDDYLQRTYDWKTMAGVAAESAVDQTFQLSKCGRPPYCFPHHIGGALTRRTARTTIELGASAVLHEDLRRTPSGLDGFHRRIVFALTHAALAKNSAGEWEPAYSRYIGTMAAVTVTRAWDGRPLTTSRLFESFGWAATSYFQDALLAEFEPDLRRWGAATWRRHLRPLLIGTANKY